MLLLEQCGRCWGYNAFFRSHAPLGFLSLWPDVTLSGSLGVAASFRFGSRLARDTRVRYRFVSVRLYMLACLSLTERAEHFATSRGIFSSRADLVIVVHRATVNPREFRLAGTRRPLVEETCNASIVHRHDARCALLFVTGRDRDNCWCHRAVLGSAASATGSKNRARHFCQPLGHGDVTLRRATVSFFASLWILLQLRF